MAKSGKGSHKNPFVESLKDRPFLPGIYFGKVISNVDINSTGRLKVRVDFLHKDPKQSHTINARWLHAFAGSTDPAKTSPEVTDYDKAMKTYGMWVQPPDIGNMVLIAFADGNPRNAFCMGSMLPDEYNYMLPGMPSGKNYQADSFNVPVVEKNKFSSDPSNDQSLRPIHHPFAEAITSGTSNRSLKIWFFSTKLPNLSAPGSKGSPVKYLLFFSLPSQPPLFPSLFMSSSQILIILLRLFLIKSVGGMIK